METKYIYSAYGKEFEATMKTLKESGIDKKIDKLIDSAWKLVKEENFDRSQLELYVCSSFRYGMFDKVMNDAISIEKSLKGEENGKV